jgi:hypothetical protein
MAPDLLGFPEPRTLQPVFFSTLNPEPANRKPEPLPFCLWERLSSREDRG